MKTTVGVLSAMIALLSAGCGLFSGIQKNDEAAAAKPSSPRLIGRIASIPPDRRFVLIESYGTWDIEQGALLTTRGLEERTANLLVTGESLGQFAAADLQSGSVGIGDAVYSLHVPKPPVSQSTSPPQADPD